MKTYQLNYLISPELSFEQANSFCQKIESIVAKTSTVIKTEKLAKKSLAFPIKKQKVAYLASIEFSSDPQKPEVLLKEIKKEPMVLRCLLLQKELKEPAPSPPKTGKTKKAKSSSQKVELKKIEEKLEEIIGK